MPNATPSAGSLSLSLTGLSRQVLTFPFSCLPFFCRVLACAIAALLGCCGACASSFKSREVSCDVAERVGAKVCGGGGLWLSELPGRGEVRCRLLSSGSRHSFGRACVIASVSGLASLAPA